jgi:hypothetical protein
VPSGERVRAYHEAPPSIPGQQTNCRGQERPIGGGETGSRSPPTEDLQLVAEQGHLEIPLIDAAADEQTEQAGKEPVRHRHEHRDSLNSRSKCPPTTRPEPRSSFFTPRPPTDPRIRGSVTERSLGSAAALDPASEILRRYIDVFRVLWIDSESFLRP